LVGCALKKIVKNLLNRNQFFIGSICWLDWPPEPVPPLIEPAFSFSGRAQIKLISPIGLISPMPGSISSLTLTELPAL
jgi:hypothetical protein